MPVVLLLSAAAFVACHRGDEPARARSSTPPPVRAAADTEISADVSRFELSIDGDEHVVTQGHVLSVAVDLGEEDARSPTILEVHGLPEGLTAAPVTTTSSQAIVEVRVAADATQGLVRGRVDAVRGERRATVALSVFVRGPAGSLDTTFADGGTYEEPSAGSTAGALVLGNDGSLFALHRCVSTVCVRRLSADGAPDATYGHAGVAWTGLDFRALRQLFALRGDDGSLIVASEGIDAIGVAKLDAIGGPVASFGTGEFGPGTMPVDLKGGIAGLSSGPKGSFFIGSAESMDGKVWMVLHGFNAIGRPKEGFGDDGRARVGLRTSWMNASRELGGHPLGLEALDERTQLVFGDALSGDTLYHGICAVSSTSGSLDPAFGVHGQQAYEVPIEGLVPVRTIGRPIAVTNATTRAFVAWKGSGSSMFYSLVAFGVDGRPATGFGKHGWTEPRPIDDEEGSPSAIAVDADGRAVLALAPTALHDATLVRFGKDGALDATFGDGHVRIEGAGAYPRVDVVIQSDGRIVTLATRGNLPDEQRMVLARFWP